MPRFYNAPVASGVALIALMAAPLAANAASSFQSGAGTLTATAAVDFTITIPRVLFLQVGTGSFLTTNAAVNLITFSVPAASVGNGTPVAATAGSGDIGNGTVTARVFGNGAANVSLSATNGGALNDGAGNTISWAQVTTDDRLGPGRRADAAEPDHARRWRDHPGVLACRGWRREPGCAVDVLVPQHRHAGRRHLRRHQYQ